MRNPLIQISKSARQNISLKVKENVVFLKKRQNVSLGLPSINRMAVVRKKDSEIRRINMFFHILKPFNKGFVVLALPLFGVYLPFIGNQNRINILKTSF